MTQLVFKKKGLNVIHLLYTTRQNHKIGQIKINFSFLRI